MSSTRARIMAGSAMVTFLLAIVAVALTLFAGGLTESLPVTVLSPRAGLVMNPEAKVQYRGVQVGTVASIEYLPDGQAALHLAMQPSRLKEIPADVVADIASPTVFGAKSVALVPSDDSSSAGSLQPGQVLRGEHVMVEVDTLFEQLDSALSSIDPIELNDTLAAVATGVRGHGEQLGSAIDDLQAVLHEVNAHGDALRSDLALAAPVTGAYADAAPDLLRIVDDTSRTGTTIVEHQRDLDALLLSATGLATLGNDVLSTNGRPLSDVLRLLVPTTSLTNQYRTALTCGLQGMNVLAHTKPLDVPGVEVSAGLLWGLDRYRFPADVPKVAATGGPQCTNIPTIPYFGAIPPFVVADVGTNPWKYGNTGIHLNTDVLKRILFGGPIDGPPRNSAQIGQPG
ncbi:virulence factor [Mycolicibacterium madagascariense]|uniref:Virulence factor n=1 Tax=Mycolicibacterium madagascariense TaxID=212765 RepID=A0A7I7XA42_9MYCO|nr:MCE family protein [Mycolicibacterium madagascariense]MCV7014164.1 MCE family protein [Mycolicibacterium madagascariense]BBZ25773.1 virulence factor [Mycolicibacterium madagascariense]